MKILSFLTIAILTSINLFGQNIYNSPKYSYSIEIPNDFNITSAVSSNVDLKAIDGVNSIVILVKQLPNEAKGLSFKGLYGDDLSNFKDDWLSGASEHFENPKFIKQGETAISNKYTFWYDFTTKSDYQDYTLYSRNYQVTSNNRLYTITLTCKSEEVSYYSAIWFRLKNSITLK